MPWDYDDAQFTAQAKADPAWYLERRITYGLEGTHLDRAQLIAYLPTIRIPQDRREFLEFVLYGENNPH
ncbi:hypothetical protein HY732_05365 [Candidatus Uhrbacteria bacterium]|nr:hypothetical protein [Candidatus Uhrbacteria bacterium]